MKNSTRYEPKPIILTCVAVLSLFSLYAFFYDETKVIIRKVLESTFTYAFLWIIIVVIFLANYLRTRSKKVSREVIISEKFNEFTDKALGGISYGTIVTTSLTLLKGIFIQYFFNDKIYFAEFQSIDLLTIFAIAVFLMYNAITKVIDVAGDTYRANRTEIVETVNSRSQTALTDEQG